MPFHNPRDPGRDMGQYPGPQNDRYSPRPSDLMKALAPEPAKLTPLEAQIARSRDALDRLEESMKAIHARLQPVLSQSPSGPGECGEPVQDAPGSSGLIAELHGLTDRILKARDDLSGLIERLEI